MSAPDPSLRQREASHPSHSVWVAASAGTGKTKVLTDRVLALLLGRFAPGRILCLTFTKAAAAEMGNRINERLSRWTTMPDGELTQDLAALTGALPDQADRDFARRLFALVLDTPGGMKILTIHAFCQSLLRRFPLESGVAPHFELMDERSAGEALDLARDHVLRSARAGEDPDLAAALAVVTREIHEEGFADLLDKLALERARLAPLLTRGFDRFAAALYRLLGLAPGETRASLLAAACAEGACDEASLRAAAQAMSASASVTDRQRGALLADWLADLASREARFAAYLRAFFTLKNERYKNILTASLARKDSRAAASLDAEATRLESLRQRLGAASLAAASLALLRLAAALIDRYERYKRDRALLDYDDLVLKSRDLLTAPGVAPWVLFKLDGGLDHILIDEAQDTNPEQWEIVRLLAEEFFAGQGARDITRTIFAVGDAKQSIFSFQRADPQAFLRMRDHFARIVKEARAKWRIVDLAISFRSAAAVLTAIDAVFARAEAADGVALDGAVIAHQPFRVGAAGLVELWPVVEPVAGEAASPWQAPVTQRQTRAPRARLALAIAAQLKQWFTAGERLASRDRPMRPRDVMVLVRRRGGFVGELVRALKQQDVPVAGVDRMVLTEQLAVEDLLALGQFLLLPEDDLTLATVLKGPLFGFDDDLLYALAQPRPGTLWAELRKRRGECAEFLAASDELGELLARADYLPPYEIFAEVLGARGGRRKMLARLGPEARDPLDEFLAAALAYERANIPSLQGFLHWLAIGEAEVKRDLDDSGRDEVRVLTIHGAKGLQAPVVFLPDTVQPPIQSPNLVWSDTGLPLWLAGRDVMPAPAQQVLQAALAKRDQEYRRLLYVAMTRAEDRLYICGWRNKREVGSLCWHSLAAAGLAAAAAAPVDFDFAPLLGPDGWAGPGLRLLTAQTEKPVHDEFFMAVEQVVAPLPAWSRTLPPPEPTPPRPLAPSQPSEVEPATRSPLGEDRGAGFQRGLLIHRLLQSLPELPVENRAAAARRFLARPVHDLRQEAQAALLRETMAILDDPVFAPLFGPGSQAEVPVVGLIGDRALSGQIDRLLVTEDRVLIVDYKTMRPVPRDADSVPGLYLAQLAAYRAALASVYPGRAIACALLWTDGPLLMPISPALLAD